MRRTTHVNCYSISEIPGFLMPVTYPAGMLVSPFDPSPLEVIPLLKWMAKRVRECKGASFVERKEMWKEQKEAARCGRFPNRSAQPLIVPHVDSTHPWVGAELQAVRFSLFKAPFITVTLCSIQWQFASL